MKWVLLLCLMATSAAQGAVSLIGTRLVFDGAYREATLDVSNRSQVEVLIQAWLSDPANKEAALPFVVTPHLTRIEARGKQTLRLLYEGVGMPADRESMLHLYVLEVPRRSDAVRQLSVAVRQRINVFYRPKGLPGDPAQAAQKVLWRVTNGQVVASNPTPFHVAMQNIAIAGVQVREDVLLAPLSVVRLPLNGDKRTRRPLSFEALTDYGGQRRYCARLADIVPVSATLEAADNLSSTGKC